MASESYGPGTFVTEFYRRLDEIGKPLDNGRKSVLESLIAETFGGSKQSINGNVESVVEDPLANQLMDRKFLREDVLGDLNANQAKIQASVLFNVVQNYAFEGNNREYRDAKGQGNLEDPTDQQALTLYQDSVAVIRDRGTTKNPLPGLRGVPSNYGVERFKLLQAYLVAKELVKEQDAIDTSQFTQN